MTGVGGEWIVHSKHRLLLMVMEELAGNAHIAFEGDLKGNGLTKIPGASENETTVLRRHTISPKLDFVLVPLEPLMARTVLKSFGRIGSRRRKPLRRIVHVQIEKDGRIEFASFDNFDPYIYFGPAISWKLLQTLISQRVLTQRPGKGERLN